MCYELKKYLTMQHKKAEKYSLKVFKVPLNDYTFMSWVNSGSAEKFHDEYKAHYEAIKKNCETHCKGECGGLEKCFDVDEIEHILENDKDEK